MPVDALHPAPARLGSEVVEVLAGLRDPHVFDLGATIEEAMPQWPDDGSRRLTRSWMVAPGGRRGTGETTFAVEALAASLHTSTHIDAVVHVQFDGLVHGGEPVASAAADGRFERGGIETIEPIVAPYVLLDVARAAGVEVVPDDADIDVGALEDALRLDGLSIVPGTVALVRTGKIRSFSTGDAYLEEQPGLTVAAAEWLCDRGVAVLGSDTAGTEPIPSRGPVGPVHRLMLFERGIPLVENLVLDQLAELGRRRGIFVCLPLKLVGATASWVRPVAIA